MIGHPLHPDAARVLQELGGDPSGFTARQLTPRVASNADLVLAMTRGHRDAVLELAPRQLNRAFTLPEAARLISELGARNIRELASLRSQLKHGDEADIPDPIGHDAEFFSQVGSVIAELLPPVLELCRNSSAGIRS
jgi:protein-tyrosine phosphatase